MKKYAFMYKIKIIFVLTDYKRFIVRYYKLLFSEIKIKMIELV